MVATMPDWKGRIFFATKGGRVGTIDPATGASGPAPSPGEAIFNSLAADETGAVYVVTDHRLLTAVADSDRAARRCAGQRRTTGARGRSPGSSPRARARRPTLIGKDLVAITDNAEPRMNVLFYKRDGSATNRLICKAPGLRRRRLRDREQPGRGGPLGHRREQLRLRGPAVHHARAGPPPRASRASMLEDDALPRRLDEQRHRADLGAEGLAGQRAGLRLLEEGVDARLDDSWYFTAIDVRTGRTQWLQRTGNGIQWNNHYASIYLGPDGAAYMPTMAGLVRFKDG